MIDLKKIVGGRMNVPEPEIHTAGCAIVPGMALTLTNGKLTLCEPTAVPTHISLGSAKDGEKVACYSVAHDHIYEVPCSASPAALTEGDKVTLGADGVTVTATTASGVATVVSLNGAKNAGDIIVVKF